MPLLTLPLLLGAVAAEAKVFHSQNEAIELAFPEADRIETDTRVLSRAEAAQVEKAARSKLASRIVKFHAGYRGGELLGRAFIDVHTVRTLPEAFLVVLTPDGRVRSLRVLAFHEPQDYMPPPRWLEQFEGRGPGDRLRLDRDIHGIVGATLSARAVTESVRRVLALHRLLYGSPPADDGQDTAPAGRARDAGDAPAGAAAHGPAGD